MKHNYKLLGFIFCFSFLLCNATQSKADIDEFSVKVNGDIYGQVRVIEDVDGDGKKDLIFGATDGKIHIYSSSGKEIFRPPYWPKQVNSPVTAGIEVADLDGNGNTNILVSTMGGTLYCLNSKGTELWKYDTGGKILIAPPVVTNLSGEDKQSIIVNSGSGRVTLLSSSGEQQMVFEMDNPVQATPLAVDTDGSHDKKIIIKDSTGKIVIFKTNGTRVSEWMSSSYPTNTNNQWPFNVEAADINGDGIPEIFTTNPSSSGGEFSMWDSDGKALSKFGISEGAHGAPKIADIDGDGVDDFIIAQTDGKVLVCDKNGKCKKGWPFENNYTIYSAPTIIDIDGDGSPEIVYTCNNGSYKDDKAGCIIALKKDGTMMEDYPKFIGKTIAPLTFADLDGDGILEIIAAGGIGYTGPQLHVFKTKAKRKFKIVTLRQQTVVK